jgi:uncharacterized protein YceK
MHDYHQPRRLISHLVALALVAVLSGCGSISAPDAATPAKVETETIQVAVQEHLARQSVPAAARIDVEMQIEQYARVRINPGGPEGHPAIGYLRSRDQTWTILGIGAAFDRDFYARYAIPQDLWLPEP